METLSALRCYLTLFALSGFLSLTDRSVAYHYVLFLSLETNYISVVCMLLVHADDEDDERTDMKGNVRRSSVRAIDFLLGRTSRILWS